MREISAKLRIAKERNRHFPLTILIVGASVVALIIVIAFAGLSVYLPYDEFVNGPKAAETLKDLEKEFKAIKPFPNASERRCGSMHKTHQGDVTCEYNTDQSYEEIRAHYDKEFRSHGWTFAKERPVTIWWRDYGGKEATYCKGIYDATLQYAGREEEAVGWTFGISMSWGLSDECK